MGKGFFGDLFDLNHDGQLDSRERLLDFIAFDEMTRDKDDDEYYDIELAGLDYDELELMDEDERREALEDAGLDADDF